MLPIDEINPARHFLGNPCKAHGHTWKETGRCLRYLHNGLCVMCKRYNYAKQMQNQEKRNKVRQQNNNAIKRRKQTEAGRKALVQNSVRCTRKRRKNDAYFCLVERLRSRVRGAFNYHLRTGKTLTSREYGIDYAAIVAHLGECPGKRTDYHIDHIIPLSHFDLSDPAQVKQAFAPENHQWLLAFDNFSKNDMRRNMRRKRNATP